MIRVTGMVLAALMAQDGKEVAPDTAEIAKAYIEANFQRRDLERAGPLLAEDALFVDPTGEVFGGPLATGVRGRAAILDLQRSWGLAGSSFDVLHEFVAGEYAVQAGKLSVRYTGGSSFEDVPFATLLRVRGGEVVERRDYGDYRQLVKAPEVEAELEQVANAYLDAYVGRRFAEVEALQAEGVVFQDPPGAMIGAGQRFEGRAAVRTNFERSFQGSLSFAFEPEYSFFFQHHAVFAGTCRFAFEGAALGLDVERAEFEIALLVALEIRDGAVVEHRDYADYTTYVEQLEALKE